VNAVSPVAIAGKTTGTYYYRVKAVKAPMADSAWVSGVNGCFVPPLTITTTSLANGAVNAVYNKTVTAINGKTPYTWSATGLPSGLTIDPATGVISGTPASVVPVGVTFANFSVIITVKDSSATPATAATTLNLRINQTVPAAPSLLAVTASSSTQVVLTWTDNANNESAFEVQRATDAAFTAGFKTVIISTPNLATYTDNTVTAGITYFYKVRSRNSVSMSVFSNTANVTTPVSVLAITTTTLANGAVNAAYNLTVGATGGITPRTWFATGLPSGLSINSTTGVVSGIPTGVVPVGITFATFPVIITVQDSAATPATATTTLNLRINQTSPAAPSGLAATASLPTRVVLTWTDNANNESAFEVQRATNAAFTTGLTSVIIPTGNLTTYADNTVTAGTTYNYRVRSRNSLTLSPFSNTANVTTP